MRSRMLAGSFASFLLLVWINVDDFYMYQLEVFCEPQVAAKIFNVRGRGTMGTKVICAGICDGRQVTLETALAGLPSASATSFWGAVKANEEAAAAGNGRSLAKCLGIDSKGQTQAPCKAPLVKYTGVIACDCNADGTDEQTRSFESCGSAGSFPTKFTSRCEDWARSSGFGFAAELTIQHDGQDWLGSIKCPALKCHQSYASCSAKAEAEYQKCITRNRLVPIGTDCLKRSEAAQEKCRSDRGKCLGRVSK